jgi:hypothetical protein
MMEYFPSTIPLFFSNFLVVLFEKMDYTIKIEDHDIFMLYDYKTIKLLSYIFLNHYRKKYNHILIGLVQVNVKILSRERLNT